MTSPELLNGIRWAAGLAGEGFEPSYLHVRLLPDFLQYLEKLKHFAP